MFNINDLPRRCFWAAAGPVRRLWLGFLGSVPPLIEAERFTFTIPADWQTMEEVWDRPAALEDDYYGLGLQEQVMIQYPPEQGQGKAFFARGVIPAGGGRDAGGALHPGDTNWQCLKSEESEPGFVCASATIRATRSPTGAPGASRGGIFEGYLAGEGGRDLRAVLPCHARLIQLISGQPWIKSWRVSASGNKCRRFFIRKAAGASHPFIRSSST